MNAIATSEALPRQKILHLTGISKKSDARQLTNHAPLIDVLPRLKRKRPESELKLKAGEFQRVKKPGEATGREHHERDTYVTGDGDTIYALRPGALDFKSLPSRTGFTS